MWILLWNLFKLLVLITSLAVGFLYVFGAVPAPRSYVLLQKLPGPRGVFYFGSALELLTVAPEDMLSWFVDKLKDYDRLMRMWFLGLCAVYLKDPKDIQVLLSSSEYIGKGFEYFILIPWLNEGLLTSSGDKWHSRRKMLTPSFHFKILENNMGTFNQNAKILCEKFSAKENDEIELERYIKLCTLEVIIRTAMGIDMDVQNEGSQQYVNELKNVATLVIDRISNPHLYNENVYFLSGRGKKFKNSVKYIHNFSNNVIQERKKQRKLSVNGAASTETSGGKKLRAFLDSMLEYEEKNPGSFSDSDIREEVDTFMFEGHDTTSAALVFIFFNLGQYQDIQEKVYNELYEIFGVSDRDTTMEDLQKMVYLEKVIKESLRLYPSVPGISRLLEHDLVLSDGLTIPAFTNVTTIIYHLHRNPNYWPEPDRFDPERFSDDQTQGRHPYAYIPFSAGPRNCIGQKFAMMELKTIVSTVVRKLKIIPVTKKEELNLVFYLVLRSTVPVKCKFVKRSFPNY